MGLFEELQSLMMRYRFAPNKKLAQNFIVSEDAVQRIVQPAGLEKTDRVIEIGAGTGFLTREMQRKCKVIAFEIDVRLCGLLQSELPKENLELHCEDFLSARLPKFNKVVSLPPYMHSSAIMYKLLGHEFDSGVIVLQKEFSDKLAALPGFMEYNALTVLAQYYFDVKIEGKIRPDCFFPKPQGESRIVVLERRETKPHVHDKKAFGEFMKTIFRFQNKNLRNALAVGYPFIKHIFEGKKEEFLEKVRSLDLQDVKTDLISVKEFAVVFNELSEK